MTTQNHGASDAPAKGLDGLLEAAFGWVQGNALVLGLAIGGVFVLGLIATLLYESNRAASEEGHIALARIERDFARDMGADRSAAVIVEPANADQARKAREAALAAFDALAADDPGSVPAAQATLRAAEMEVDLAEYASAETRLASLVASLDDNDAIRAIAQRLRGYALEQQARYADAGVAYAAGAEVGGYPTPVLLLAAAGRAFERGDADDRAIEVYQRALTVDPEYAEAVGLLDRIDTLRATGGASAATAGVPAETAP